MRRSARAGILMVAATLMVSGCFGPFNLTRRLYRWNSEVSDKWGREFLFILLAWAPVYGLTLVGDAVVFNSMEFWTGKNPVDAPPRAGLPSEPAIKRIVRGQEEAVLTFTRTAQGPRLVIEQFRAGVSAGTLTIERQDGRSIGVNEEGRVVLAAQSSADGRVVVSDGHGMQLANYPAQPVEQSIHARLSQRLAATQE